jgi:hypothetical protein
MHQKHGRLKVEGENKYAENCNGAFWRILRRIFQVIF